MNKFIISVCTALLLLCLGMTVAAAETVVYVSDAGNDLADGKSDATPLKTLAAAYDYLPKDGGKIVVCKTCFNCLFQNSYFFFTKTII